MSQSNLSALVSLTVAVVVLSMGFFQLYRPTSFGGAPELKVWPRVVFTVLVAALVVAGALLVTS